MARALFTCVYSLSVTSYRDAVTRITFSPRISSIFAIAAWRSMEDLMEDENSRKFSRKNTTRALSAKNGNKVVMCIS